MKPKNACWMILVLLFFASILPLLVIAFFNHPQADDYSYALDVHAVWKDSHSVLAAAKSAALEAKKTYGAWQGTFVSVFLMAIQPAVFGENFYLTVPYVMLFSLIAGTLFLFKVILRDHLGASRCQWLGISLLLLFLSIQLAPSPVEAFFWYNGSVHYVLMYSVMLVVIGFAMQLLKRTGRARLPLTAAAMVGALFVGGGNYVTAISLFVALAIISVLLIIEKNYRLSFLVVLVLLSGSLTLFVSAFAPGNAKRQAVFDELIRTDHGKKLTAPDAIMESFFYSWKFMVDTLSVQIFTGAVLVALIAYRFVGQCKYQFYFPFVALLLSWCLWSSQFCPPLYTMSWVGPGRVNNILYWTFLNLLFLNVVYVTGWLAKRFGRTGSQNTSAAPAAPSLLVIIIVLVVNVISWGYQMFHDPESWASASAYRSIRSGEAQRYDESLQERVAKLEDPSFRDVVVKPLAEKPKVLFFADITNNREDWKNVFLAQFYGKASVVLGKP